MAENINVDLWGEKARFVDRCPKIKFHHNPMLSVQAFGQEPWSFLSFISKIRTNRCLMCLLQNHNIFT